MRCTVAILALFLALPSAAPGQTVPVGAAGDTLRAAPEGTALAALNPGTPVAPGRTRDGWREATVEGWIWAASVTGSGDDLVVTPAGGENLRAEPNGPVLARLFTGMRLREVERRGRWIRVRRTGWIPAAPPAGDGPAKSASPPAPESQEPAPSAAGPTRAGAFGAALLRTPEGDTLASIRPAAEVEALERDGEWVRVRVEGWVHGAGLEGAGSAGAGPENLTPAMLAANPDAARGRLVLWTVQFIALQTAEPIRTDLREGEPFLLTRGPGEEAGFVYVAVPEAQLDRVLRLRPLQRITVLARVRAGRSPLTGAPVLELVELR